MSKFKIGDRVKYVGIILGLKGKVGTVVCLPDYCYDVGVAFDDRISFLHDLDGFCEKNHGWYCHNIDLKLADDEHRFNVIITSVGDTTTAKLLHEKKVEKEVSVKRYYKDDYSEEAAVEAVCEKLFGARTSRKRMPNLWESTARRCACLTVI